MARVFTLTANKGGINRERTEGSPSPEVLYDLLNGYINSAAKMVSRPGTRITHRLPVDATKGFVVFRGDFVVFSHTTQTVPSGVVCQVIQHPALPTLPIAKIHYASPFLQYLYVVAEFANGDIYHYWLQAGTAWQANHIYLFGELVEPTTPNGLVYAAERLTDPYPLWQPNVLRTVGNKIEPTTTNSYYYECTATLGTNPRSAATEPTWATEDGGLTYEYADATPVPPASSGSVGSGSVVNPGTVDRYENQSGSVIDSRREQ